MPWLGMDDPSTSALCMVPWKIHGPHTAHTHARTERSKHSFMAIWLGGQFVTRCPQVCPFRCMHAPFLSPLICLCVCVSFPMHARLHWGAPHHALLRLPRHTVHAIWVVFWSCSSHEWLGTLVLAVCGWWRGVLAMQSCGSKRLPAGRPSTYAKMPWTLGFIQNRRCLFLIFSFAKKYMDYM
jgi:hypothetical protein